MPLAAPRSAVAERLTKPVAVACAKKVPTAMSTMPTSTATRYGVTSSGSATPAIVNPIQRACLVPTSRTVRPASGVVNIDGRKTKYTNPSCMEPSDSGSREHEIHECEGADEGEQDAEADAEAGPQRWALEVQRPDRERCCLHDPLSRHGRCLMHGEVDHESAGEVENRKNVEVCGQAQMIGDRRGHEAADQIACDIARDVGGKSAGSVGGGVLLAEVGERQCEGRSHEDALGDTKKGEGAEPGSHRQQCGRYGE